MKWLVLLALLNSCDFFNGKIEVAVNPSDISDIPDGPVLLTTVDPIYPVSGINWNDYVRRSNAVHDGSWYKQNDIACDGTEVGIHSICIHGGEKKKVILTGTNSCEGIKASDTLGVFNWTCEVIGGVATVMSKGIKEDKGLNDLIDNTPAWRENSVTVTKTFNNHVVTVAKTSPAIWWNNDVVPLVTSNSGAVTLVSNVGDIHVLTSPASTQPIRITTDKVTILIKSSAILSYDPFGGWDSILSFQGVKHTWLEGSFHAQNASSDAIAYDSGSNFNKIRKVRVVNPQSSSLYIVGNSNYVYDLKVFGDGPHNAGDEAIWVDSGDYLVLNKLNLSNTGTWNNIVFWNQSSRVENSTFVNVLTTGSKKSGIECNNGSGHGIEKVTFHNITSARNEDSGFWCETDAIDITISNMLAAANALKGIGFYNHTNFNLKLANIAAIDNGQTPILLQLTANATVHGNLIVGNNGSSCDAGGANTNPPFDSSCNPINGNVFNLASTTATSAASFVGEVTSNDLVNTESSNVVLFNSITDFFNFENFYRTWGRENIFTSSLTGSCDNNQNCEILDYRLVSTDTYFLNKLGNGTSLNHAFTPGLACPVEIGGNEVLTDSQTSPNTFMKMAVEIMEDSVGDDDGLCESNEGCIYSPNFGAYQGDGDFESRGACLFQDGIVTGVIMYAYPTNGG